MILINYDIKIAYTSELPSKMKRLQEKRFWYKMVEVHDVKLCESDG